jgi:general secretion pathway protein G
MRIAPLIVLFSLLIGCGKPVRIDSVDYTRRAQLAADIQRLHAELAQYKDINGFYPTTEQGLRALVTAPSTDPRPARWQQFMEQVLMDPWDDAYFYRCPGLKDPAKYDLFSAGPDRVADTADDDWGR